MPAHKFGTSSRSNFLGKSNSQVPGPGSYSSDSPEKVKSSILNQSFGKDKKLQDQKILKDTEQIAPGSYSHKEYIGNSNSKQSFSGVEKIKDQSQNVSPGPGQQYNSSFCEETLKKNAKYGNFGLKIQNSIDEQNYSPGPASYNNKIYNIDQNQDISPQLGDKLKGSWNKCPRSKDRIQNNPGPGQYDDSIIMKYENSAYQNFGIKTKNCQFDDSENSPGPGAQIIKSTLNVTPGASIKSKLKLSDRNENPGPGSQEANQSCDTGFKSPVSFTKGKRRDLLTNTGPGPCVQNPILKDKNKSPEISISSTKKPDMAKRFLTPGPGHQKDVDTSFKISYSILGKKHINEHNHNDSPGPNHYSVPINSVKDSFNGYSLSKSFRQGNFNIKESPGPGEQTYETPDKKNMTLKTTFGLANKLNYKQNPDSPGPGQYEIKSLVGELPKFELMQLHEIKKKSSKPLHK